MTDEERTVHRRRDLMAELAEAIERAWISGWGKVPVVASVVIDRIRRGKP